MTIATVFQLAVCCLTASVGPVPLLSDAEEESGLREGAVSLLPVLLPGPVAVPLQRYISTSAVPLWLSGQRSKEGETGKIPRSYRKEEEESYQTPSNYESRDEFQ